MDELRLNKVFAGFLFAALLLMAGIKVADVMVPHQELAENAYVIEVAETTDIATAAPVSYTHLRAHETREDLVWRRVR